MAIVTSTYTATGSEGERRRVIERHTDHLGQQYTNEYWASASANIEQMLSEHADVLGAQLAESEINAELG